MTRSWQKDRQSNVFRPVYSGLFVLQSLTLIFYPGDFRTNKNPSSNLNVISYYEYTNYEIVSIQSTTRENTDYDRLHYRRFRKRQLRVPIEFMNLRYN
jgi:hypothetical protein